MLACSNLGTLEYRQGREDKAGRLYTKACLGGEILGCSNLGTLEYQWGHYDKAKKLYSSSCDKGDWAACSYLGVLEEGRGNTANAKRLYRKACRQGNVDGCSNLGMLEYLKGNPERGKSRLEKLCRQGQPKILSRVGKNSVKLILFPLFCLPKKDFWEKRSKTEDTMAKIATSHTKRRLVGNKVSHANNRTKMAQKPNLHYKRIYDPESGQTIRLRLSTSAIRTLDKVGGLSKLLRKHKHLSHS